METLFGIRSNIAFVAVGLLFLLISLNTSIYEMQTIKFGLSEEHAQKEYLLINTKTRLFHIVAVILSVSCLLSSILLILGTMEKRYGMLQPWLMINIVLETILTSCFLYFIYLFVQFHHSSWNNATGLLLAIFVDGIAMGFLGYLWNGTYTLYKQYKAESRRLYPLTDNEGNAAGHPL